jgi:aromatic ring-opening dioxygenase catalytic subunit (LigB family)
MSTRAPVYFISHGGPPSLFTPGSKPNEAWRATGTRIRREVKSGLVKGLVCVSAHWEDENGGRGVSSES